MNSQPDLSSRLAIDTKGVDSLRQSSKQNSAQSVKAVAQQFEALFMNTVMKSMREAGSKEGGVFDNEQSKMFTGMLDQQLSQNMAKRGVGLADVLIRQLSPQGVVSPEEAAKTAAAGKTGLDAAKPLNNPLIAGLNKSSSGMVLTGNLDASGVSSNASVSSKANPISPAKAKLLADLQAMSEMDANFRQDTAGGLGKDDDLSGLSKITPANLRQYLEQGKPAQASADGKLLKIEDWRPNLGSGISVKAAQVNTANLARQPAHVREFQTKLAAQAEEASRATGIPAKFLIGQAALESGWGRHEIKGADGKSSHNLFGIKATSGWKGKVVEAVTTEYVNGTPQLRREKFRAYDSYADAFKDYGRMLSKNPRYENVIANAQDASSFARGLQRAGYATDPNYAAKLTRIINNSLS